MKSVKFRKSGIINVGPETDNTVGIYGVVINQKRNRIYISCCHTPTVAIIDANKGKVVCSIKLCKEEYHFFSDIGWNPVYDKLYVSNNQFDTVWVVNGKTEKVAKALRLGGFPSGIAVHEKTGKAYIAIGQSGELVVLNGKTDQVETRIKVEPWPYPVAVDSQNNLALVVCQMDHLARFQNFEDPWKFKPGVLCIIDTKSNRVIRKVRVGRRSRGIAVNPKRAKVYVSNRSDDNVHVIDEFTGKTKKIIQTQCNPFGITFNPNNEQIYVVNLLGQWYDNIGQPSTVTVINSKKDVVLQHIPVGKITYHMAVNPTTNMGYTADEDNAQVSVINCDKNEVEGIIDGFGLTIDDISINPKTQKLYLPGHFLEGTIVVDARKKKVDAKIKSYGWITSAVVNPVTNKIYVSNQEAGYVDVIDGRRNKIVTKINLGIGSNLMHRLWPIVSVDSKLNQVYVPLVRWNGLAVLDGQKDLLMHRIKLGPMNLSDPGQFAGSCEFGTTVNEKTACVYVNDPVNRMVSIIDGKTLNLLKQVSLRDLELPLYRKTDPGYTRKNSPFDHLKVDEKNNRVFAYTWILDGQTGATIGRIPSQHGTGITCVDTKHNRIYVHGWNGLTVLDLNTFEKLGFLPLKSTAKGDNELRLFFAVDPENNRVYAVKNLMVDGNRLRVFDIVSK